MDTRLTVALPLDVPTIYVNVTFTYVYILVLVGPIPDPTAYRYIKNKLQSTIF